MEKDAQAPHKPSGFGVEGSRVFASRGGVATEDAIARRIVQEPDRQEYDPFTVPLENMQHGGSRK